MTSFKPAKPTTSRVGRENQLYNPETGARMVAGCICLNDTRDRVLMILSSVHKDTWVLPKGGVESEESEDFAVAAARESWEEAGCEGCIGEKLPVVYDMRGKKAPVLEGQARKDWDPGKIVPKLEFHFYTMEGVQLSPEWPELKQRKRKWCTYSEARRELLKGKRVELVAALEASCIVKDTDAVADAAS
ncbi:hypothetical protein METBISCDRAFT_18072 [Metschnikowia bicuspidata]|uniref:Nudix hydrolase domain-containing protein n=1 Tax=Metschnikowia bicuspidata TaxID=27322 RepID=A0A4P9ZCU6_9ASCO|nr:hypothetical protein METBISCDRAFT_18072 [Metschnikowia bicuspidata]